MSTHRKLRFCFNCGEELGCYADYDQWDTCGKPECERQARRGREEERTEAHERLDRDHFGCNARIILCEACGSEGRVLRAEYSADPNPRDCGPCPYCEGTGGEIIETQPIELEDLDEMCGETV